MPETKQRLFWLVMNYQGSEGEKWVKQRAKEREEGEQREKEGR